MKRTTSFVALALFLQLTSTSEAQADGILGWLGCFYQSDITEEIRSSVRGRGHVSYGTAFDAEIYNNHQNLTITSMTIEIKGTYGGRPFTRKYPQDLAIEPGYSQRLYISLYLSDVILTDWSFSEVMGC